ncbi:MAG TPA: hypothetical protein PKH07_18875, partial [bacterium]|nr:hypothetical protein [bacterium]
MTRSVGVAYLLFALLILVSASFVSAEDRIYQTESEAHAAALEAAQLDLQKQIYKARVDSVTPMDIYLTTQWKLRDQVQDVMSEAIVAQESSAEEGQVVVILEVPIDSIPLRIRGFYREYGLYVRGQGVALCPRTRTTMPDLDSSQFVWQDQILSAMGEGKARDDTSDTEGLQQAFHAARAEAMRNLGAMMESLSLSGDRTLRDLISTNQAVRYRVHSLIGRATPTKVDFVSEDVCQVTLELPLSLLPAALAVESASEEA